MTLHERFAQMKKTLKERFPEKGSFTNSHLEEITGYSPNSIKSMTQSSQEIKHWLKFAIEMHEWYEVKLKELEK